MKASRFIPIVGIIVFIAIIWNIGVPQILNSFICFDIFFFSLSLLVAVPLIFIKALKWKMLIKSNLIDYPLSECISAWLIGFSVGLITPGRLGDFSRALYLKESKNISLSKSLSSVFLDRIMDVLVLFCFVVIGVLVFTIIYTTYKSFYVMFIVLFILLLVFILTVMKKNHLRFILKFFFDKAVPQKHKLKLESMFRDFCYGIESTIVRKDIILYTTVFTTISWFIVIFQYYILTLVLGLNVPYQFLVFVIPITLLLEILPISFSGLGTREAALIFFLSFISIPANSAILFSFSILLLTYIEAIPGLLLWFKKPMKF